MEDELRKVVCDQLKISDADYHVDLAAGDIPAWDSLGHVNLLMAVEKHFRVSFDVSDSVDIETISDLVDTTKHYLEQKGE